MKIIITEEQFNNLIPLSVKRRMKPEDFGIIDDNIHKNKRYYFGLSFDGFFEGLIRDSLNEFIKEYKVEEINPNLDDDVYEREENLVYKIFWQLIPFLKKKYYDEIYEYYTDFYRKNKKSLTESSDNKRNHLYRRIGEIEDVFKEYEDLFIRTAKGLDKDGFIHATSMFIGDILAGRLEERDTDFDYVTFRNQIKVFVQSHFYQELSDFYNKHKKQLTESQYERLFTDLPPFLKRRITLDDLKYFDDNISSYILSTPPTDDFKDFSSVVIGDLLHDFIMEIKGDEIETEENPDYGVVYKDESRDKIMGMYWDLKPILIKKYKNRLYQTWERKKSL
jgi:hypothetical protein